VLVNESQLIHPIQQFSLGDMQAIQILVGNRKPRRMHTFPPSLTSLFSARQLNISYHQKTTVFRGIQSTELTSADLLRWQPALLSRAPDKLVDQPS
jgi:hypothetical protein